jgi:hypothetical protein
MLDEYNLRFIILFWYDLVEFHADYQIRFYDNNIQYISGDIVCFIFSYNDLVYNK